MTAGDRLPEVLVVDDEQNIRELVQVALRFHGFTVTTAATGTDALHHAAAGQPDLVVLDVMLPDLDGFEVCRRFRAGGNEVPVIFLTARDTSSDTVTGLALGGDDYVTKPFSVEALVARIRAVLRRVRGAGRAEEADGANGLGDADVLRVADLEIDEARWAARRGDTELELSPTEFRLLAFLTRHPGRVLTRAQLLEHVWGWDYGGQSQIVEALVTHDHLSDEIQASLGQMSLGQFADLAIHPPFTITLQDGTKLRAVARRVAALQVSNAGLGVPVGGRLYLVVGRPLLDFSDPLRGVILAELITGGALIVLLALGGRWLIGRGLAPVGRMATAADRITDSGDLTARMPDAAAGTETGRLAGAINTMLDRIQHAFAARWHSEQKKRTFAADASHELRTPLTTIRGYAELYRHGALGPAELPNAMRRIEEEAGRMSTLVAELLELARLDRTSSLELTECDLAAVVRDAAADAAAVEPGRPIKVEAPERFIAGGRRTPHSPGARQPARQRAGAHEPADTGGGTAGQGREWRGHRGRGRGAGHVGGRRGAGLRPVSPRLAWLAERWPASGGIGRRRPRACQSCRRSQLPTAARRCSNRRQAAAPSSGSGYRTPRDLQHAASGCR